MFSWTLLKLNSTRKSKNQKKKKTRGNEKNQSVVETKPNTLKEGENKLLSKENLL